MAMNNRLKSTMAEINVTPLVDVMLVLLVIFMITETLLLNGINLDLPKTQEVNRINLTTSQVVLSVTQSGEYYLGADKILYSELISEINNNFTKNKTDVLYLRADFKIRYGAIASLMSYLKKNGISKLALVTENEEKK